MTYGRTDFDSNAIAAQRRCSSTRIEKEVKCKRRDECEPASEIDARNKGVHADESNFAVEEDETSEVSKVPEASS